MFFHARADRQNVGVEDDVCGRKADFLRQQFVRALTDPHFLFAGGRLPGFVERHHDHGGSVATDKFRAAQKLGLAFLQADTVDDAFTVNALQTCFKDFPIRAVDHDRHTNVIIVQQPQEFLHAARPVQQPFVHIDVNDLRAAFDLIARNADGFVKLVFANQPQEFARTRDVCAFADVHKIRFRTQGQIIESRIG